MKERPITFSPEMVEAILEGRKTQTRRVIKPRSEGVQLKNSDIVEDCHTSHNGRFMLSIWTPWNSNTPLPLMIKFPYGQVGDRLWVREQWCIKEVNGKDELAYYTDSDLPCPAVLVKWNNPLFMPRWASRITLEITRVGVERLQDIGPEDLAAEGFWEALHPADIDQNWVWDNFIDLWDSLNAKRSFPWTSNPWVWVLEFKHILIAQRRRLTGVI